MPWLMKAEPDTRLERGIDVKFSIDDFEELGISKWDGVRNHEAKKIMKEKMKVGDEVLFYHSNCKVPGVYGIATVHKEGYPDYTAWDEKHPYYDAKSKQDSPTWFMVDVEFKARVKHPVTLALLKLLASSSALPESLAYIQEPGFKAIKAMALVNRGRLSVQPVTREAYDTILLLGEKGGWDDLIPAGKNSGKRKSKAEAGQEAEEGPVKRNGRRRNARAANQANSTGATEDNGAVDKKQNARATKRQKVEKVDAKPRINGNASESDLSDLPSSDEAEASFKSGTEDIAKAPIDEQLVGGESAGSGNRRSVRQRAIKAGT